MLKAGVNLASGTLFMYIFFMDNIKTLQTIFIYGLFGLLFFLLMAMLQPFFTVILWAALLYVLFKPLHGKIFKKMDKTKRFFELKRNLLAAAFSVGIFLLIIGPLVGLGFMLVQQLLSFLTGIENFLLENPDFFNFRRNEGGVSDCRRAESGGSRQIPPMPPAPPHTGPDRKNHRGLCPILVI